MRDATCEIRTPRRARQSLFSRSGMGLPADSVWHCTSSDHLVRRQSSRPWFRHVSLQRIRTIGESLSQAIAFSGIQGVDCVANKGKPWSQTSQKIGENFYANFDCIMLDTGGIHIGNDVLLARGVGIYTPNHSVHAAESAAGGCFPGRCGLPAGSGLARAAT